MTIGEIISEFKEQIPYGADDAILIRWLSEIEQTLVSEVLLTHEAPPEGAADFSGYKFSDSRDRELFAEEPFCRLYTEYLAMKYYIAVCDIPRYNAFAELFYNSYGNFADDYNRKKRPLGKVSKFRIKGAGI